MATITAEMMLRYVFDGSLSMNDFEIERRPYHRDCKCALHKSKGSERSSCCPGNSRISNFPKKDLQDLGRGLMLTTNAPVLTSHLDLSFGASRRRTDVKILFLYYIDNVHS